MASWAILAPGGFVLAMAVALSLVALGAVRAERRRILRGLRAREERTLRIAQEDAALRRVATMVASEAPAAEVMDAVGHEVADLLEAEAGAVVRYLDDMHVTTVGGWRRWSTAAAADGPWPPRPTGEPMEIHPGSAVDRIRRSGHAQRFDERGRALSMPPIRQRVAAPIRVGGRIWGAVIAATKSDVAFGDDAEDRLESFADLVGLAVANADAREQLRAQANTDPLTGLLNHRTFHERLRAEVARAKRHARELSVALFDIDHFKSVNDTHGHIVGDHVLAEAARRLLDCVRAGEVVARLGGDELAVLMPETGSLAGYAAVERVREAISAVPFHGAGGITVSAGLCDMANADSAEELLRLADGALYWAKGHGRDACYRYTPEVVHELSAGERAERLERSQALAGLRALARATDAKDPSTIRHSERVAELVGLLAAARGWSEADIRLLREAALIHDVGKIGVPDAVLAKPGRLTVPEHRVVQRHAALGAQIAAEVLSGEQVAWIRGHHERHDGNGYPDGLAANEVPEGARLLALADAWDAMTRVRSYSAPMTLEAALAEVRAQTGTQFAPDAVDALERMWETGELGDPELSSERSAPPHDAAA